MFVLRFVCFSTIFVIETHFNINKLYTLLFMSLNNLMRDDSKRYWFTLYHIISVPISVLPRLRFIVYLIRTNCLRDK